MSDWTSPPHPPSSEDERDVRQLVGASPTPSHTGKRKDRPPELDLTTPTLDLKRAAKQRKLDLSRNGRSIPLSNAPRHSLPSGSSSQRVLGGFRPSLSSVSNAVAGPSRVTASSPPRPTFAASSKNKPPSSIRPIPVKAATQPNNVKQDQKRRSPSATTINLTSSDDDSLPDVITALSPEKIQERTKPAIGSPITPKRKDYLTRISGSVKAPKARNFILTPKKEARPDPEFIDLCSDDDEPGPSTRPPAKPVASGRATQSQRKPDATPEYIVIDDEDDGDETVAPEPLASVRPTISTKGPTITVPPLVPPAPSTKLSNAAVSVMSVAVSLGDGRSETRPKAKETTVLAASPDIVETTSRAAEATPKIPSLTAPAMVTALKPETAKTKPHNEQPTGALQVQATKTHSTTNAEPLTKSNVSDSIPAATASTSIVKPSFIEMPKAVPDLFSATPQTPRSPPASPSIRKNIVTPTYGTGLVKNISAWIPKSSDTGRKSPAQAAAVPSMSSKAEGKKPETPRKPLFLTSSPPNKDSPLFLPSDDPQAIPLSSSPIPPSPVQELTTLVKNLASPSSSQAIELKSPDAPPSTSDKDVPMKDAKAAEPLPAPDLPMKSGKPVIAGSPYRKKPNGTQSARKSVYSVPVSKLPPRVRKPVESSDEDEQPASSKRYPKSVKQTTMTSTVIQHGADNAIPGPSTVKTAITQYMRKLSDEASTGEDEGSRSRSPMERLEIAARLRSGTDILQKTELTVVKSATNSRSSSGRPRGRPRKNVQRVTAVTTSLKAKTQAVGLPWYNPFEDPDRPAIPLDSYLPDMMNSLGADYDLDPHRRVIFEAMIKERDGNAPPITIVNEVDNQPCPPFEFMWTNDMLYGNDVPRKNMDVKGCDCVGPCDPKNKSCACVLRQEFYASEVGEGFAYGEDGTLQFWYAPIFECNDACGCSESCRNRVVQKGRKYRLSIRKTPYKGWGVFADEFIPAAAFIGVYSGELLTDEEAGDRGEIYQEIGRTYLFNLDSHHLQTEKLYATELENYTRRKKGEQWTNKYAIDAFHAGNHTRFLNHSCNPNVEQQTVYVDDADVEKPLLCLFTRCDIEPNQELCFSYHNEDEPEEVIRDGTSRAGKRKFDATEAAVRGKCQCGAPNCRGYMFNYKTDVASDSSDEEEVAAESTGRSGFSESPEA